LRVGKCDSATLGQDFIPSTLSSGNRSILAMEHETPVER
jgi:hypothetical protein